MKARKLNLNTIWVIAWKDISDVLTNKSTLINILIVIGMVIFFWWGSTPRPFDKKIDVVYFDQGSSNLPMLTEVTPSGYQFRFSEVDSVEEIGRSMGYKQIGIQIPADFDHILSSRGCVCRGALCSRPGQPRVAPTHPSHPAGPGNLGLRTAPTGTSGRRMATRLRSRGRPAPHLHHSRP